MLEGERALTSQGVSGFWREERYCKLWAKAHMLARETHQETAASPEKRRLRNGFKAEFRSRFWDRIPVLKIGPLSGTFWAHFGSKGGAAVAPILGPKETILRSSVGN